MPHNWISAVSEKHLLFLYTVSPSETSLEKAIDERNVFQREVLSNKIDHIHGKQQCIERKAYHNTLYGQQGGDCIERTEQKQVAGNALQVVLDRIALTANKIGH